MSQSDLERHFLIFFANHVSNHWDILIASAQNSSLIRSDDQLLIIFFTNRRRECRTKREDKGFWSQRRSLSLQLFLSK